MKQMVELKNMTKNFKNEALFSGLNLTLYDNMIYGFVGRNGSGKSVLFKLICGYVRPDSGEIYVEGKKLGKDLDFPESMGALIEKPGFMWYESGFSNLKYLAGIKKLIDDETIKEYMRLVELDPKSKKRVGKYSLGMKQRLGIAQAIMESPSVLILDEPMNGLDEEGVETVRKIISEYKREGRAIILSSHNKEDIDLLCDEVYRVSSGKLIRI